MDFYLKKCGQLITSALNRNDIGCFCYYHNYKIIKTFPYFTHFSNANENIVKEEYKKKLVNVKVPTYMYMDYMNEWRSNSH